MRKLLLFSLLASNMAWAELPLSFTSSPSVTNMAIGQVQTLVYTIRNNLTKTLPLQNISIINDGDTQPAAVTQLITTCGSSLAPQAACSLTVTIRGIQSGNLNRHLNIVYGGRTPLVAPVNVTASQADYTVLIYIVGSSLESNDNAATFNINQMKQIGSTPDMNIVIETGGANKPGWLTVQRKLVRHNDVLLLDDLGNKDMSLPSTIQNFFKWGVTQFPANKYIAIFWDHGGGPNDGFGGDELHSEAATSISELSGAMQNVSQVTGKKFEIIGFDTCLLGNVETFAGLAPYTNYLIGSEDLEPGLGWQYNTFLSYVNTHPTANGLNIGQVIVNGFTLQNEGQSTTNAVISAAEIPSVITALNQFTTALSPYINSNIANWKQVARGRLSTADYKTSVWDPDQVTDVADLLGLATNMAAAFPSDLTLQNASNSLISATQNAVKYFKNSPNRAASFGLTIYFPSMLANYVTSYPSKTLLNGQSFFSTDYTSLVSNYAGFYTSQTAALLALPSGLAFDGTAYTASVSNDFEDLYAAAGNDACTNVFYANGTSLGTVPCYTTIQSNGVTAVSAGGNAWNISYNKTANIAQWPLLNNVPALLIALDSEPVNPDEISFIIPVTSETEGNGYLNLVKSNNVYNVVGFQQDTGSANPDSKVTNIPNGKKFYIRTYANDGTGWNLYRTSVQVTSPFTVRFGTLPISFNAFRFLDSDLTGALHITATSQPYTA